MDNWFSPASLILVTLPHWSHSIQPSVSSRKSPRLILPQMGHFTSYVLNSRHPLSTGSPKCFDDMLCDALDYQLPNPDFFVRISLLIAISQNYFPGFFIHTCIKLQRIQLVSPTLAELCFLITTISPLSMPASVMESPSAFRM